MDLSIKRHRRWFHFSLFGRVRMADSAMLAIINSPTTTEEAKELARSLFVKLDELKSALKERID